MSAPEVSVVIASGGRRETRLAFALEALAEQTLARERFEVIVVRNPAPGPMAGAPPGLPVRFLEPSEAGGPGANRNLGWRAARAPLVAFTDDDCRPAPGWLEALLEASAPDAVVQGRTEPEPEERHLSFGLARTQEITGPSDWYETCNLAYPRPLLERLDGFDETFTGWGFEDTDLGLRARAAGARLLYRESALVWHAVHLRHLRRSLALAREPGLVALLLARHPEQRRALYRGVFWQRSHALVSLAAAGLLTRRLPLALAAAWPYVAEHLRAYDRSPRGAAGGLLDLPVRAAADAVETAVTVRGALRHRVLVV